MGAESTKNVSAALVALVLHGALLAWPVSTSTRQRPLSAQEVFVDTLVVPEAAPERPVPPAEPVVAPRVRQRARTAQPRVAPPAETSPPEPELPPPPSNRPGDDLDTPVVTGVPLALLDTGPGVFTQVGNTEVPGFEASGDGGLVAGYQGGRSEGLGRRARSAGVAGTTGRPLTRAPHVLREVKPVYPASLVDAHIEGSVRLRVEVLAEGRTGRVEVLKSQGPVLDAVASTALRGFLWSPAELDGDPVTTFVLYDFVFELTD